MAFFFLRDRQSRNVPRRNEFQPKPPMHLNIRKKTMNTKCSSLTSVYNEWVQLLADCMWTFGYRSSRLSYLLAMIPSSIGGLLKIVNALSQDPCPSFVWPLPECVSPEVAQALSLEKSMWHSQNEYGFLELSYDPATGDQSGVAINTLREDTKMI